MAEFSHTKSSFAKRSMTPKYISFSTETLGHGPRLGQDFRANPGHPAICDSYVAARGWRIAMRIKTQPADWRKSLAKARAAPTEAQTEKIASSWRIAKVGPHVAAPGVLRARLLGGLYAHR
jgi:hypothetical protein